MPPHETLAAVSSRLNSKALATHIVLAHPCTTFHPCMCGLHRGAAMIAAALIGYIRRGSCQADHKEKVIVIDYFLYTDMRQCWIAAPTPLLLLCVSSGSDDL
jgi:hypothetical protein